MHDNASWWLHNHSITVGVICFGPDILPRLVGGASSACYGL